MKGSTLVLDDEADFPSSPGIGQLCFKGGVLYLYALINATETWFPLTNKTQHHIHNQALSATTWTVSHQLGTENVVFMAYNSTGDLLSPSNIVFDNVDNLTLEFLDAEAGKVVVFGASEQYAPALNAEALSIGSDIDMSGTTISVGGIDIVALLDQVNTDLNAMFSWNGTNEEITFKGDLLPETTETFSIGSATRKVKDLYVSASTVHIGDELTIDGTSLTIDAGISPTSLADTPSLSVSSLTLKPFTYNPGGGDITVEPVLQFQNTGGQQYGISFNLGTNSFQFNSPAGVGEGKINAKEITSSGKITCDSLETTGTDQLQMANDARFDGDVILGYDGTSNVVIKGTVDLQTAITFGEAATLGDGNDDITINSGAANDFIVTSRTMGIDVNGDLTMLGAGEFGGNVTVGGDLIVNGTTTTVNTATLEVTDNVIVANKDEAGAGITAGSGGLEIERGTLPNAKLVYNEVSDQWEAGIEGSMTQLSVGTHDHDADYLRTDADSAPDVDNVHDIGDITHRFANVFANIFNGDLTGNAGTADALSSAQTIALNGDVSGSASFDGSAGITINATVADDSHTHDGRYFTETETDARYLRKDTDSVPDVDLAIDLGDATHRFSQVFAQSFKGNADTAEKLRNTFDLSLTGDVTGSIAIDGSGNVSLAATVVNDSHEHDGRYYTESEADGIFIAKTQILDAADMGGATPSATDVPSQNAVNDFVADKLDDCEVTNLSIGPNDQGTVSDIAIDGSANIASNASMHFFIDSDNNATAEKFTWETNAGYGTGNELMNLTEAGDLTVTGDVAATIFNGMAGTATYADLAEKYTCEEEYVYPGTVMSACESGEFEVQECVGELARNVIGVVSEEPAYLMNNDEDGVAVALTGKVPVRIIGPVGKGQPIVAAGNGVARAIRRDAELLYKIGTAFEENLEQEEKLVMCSIK